MEIDDLKLIKKYFGEKMMHLCRELFPSILERKGLLFKLIDENFNRSKFLYNDIINSSQINSFKNLIYSGVDVENNYEVITHKNPKELMDEVGYNLYECKTEEDIQNFKKYYAPGEELCTFKGNRLEDCYVFFAVKKDVDNIKREDFKNPERQDKYGTSVISIQFTRGDINTLSIKNRYNHRVNNPDATFCNNLDNIIPTLTNSFNRYYNLNINSNKNNVFELNNYVLAYDKKYYKYNYEINNIYYCPDNVVIDHFKVKKYPKEKYIVFDQYILDLVNRKIYNYKNSICDSFINSIGEIESIKVSIDKENQFKNIIINNNIVITLNKYSQIIGYKNECVKLIGDDFLFRNTSLCSINLSKVKVIGKNFLRNNQILQKLNLPNVEVINNDFLINSSLKSICMPKVKIIGDFFLAYNKNLSCSLDFLELKVIGNFFLKSNELIETINMPKLETIGYCFLVENNRIKLLNLPNLKNIDGNFLLSNDVLEFISLPNLSDEYYNRLPDICKELLKKGFTKCKK